MQRMLKSIFKAFLVLLFWLLLWQILAFCVSKPDFDGNLLHFVRDFFISEGDLLLLPGPIPVLCRLIELVVTPIFWKTAAVSLLRVVTGVLVAVLLGSLLAALSFRFKLIAALISPFISVVKSTPVSSFIILALLWIGRASVPSCIAGLIVLPAVYENLITGFSRADTQLLEMARVFGVSKLHIVKRIYVSALKPYFFSACRLSLGLAWKAGIAAEVLSLPKTAIGKYLYESKMYLETVDLFAWTLTVIVLSIIIEKLFVGIVKNYSKGEENDRA